MIYENSATIGGLKQLGAMPRYMGSLEGDNANPSKLHAYRIKKKLGKEFGRICQISVDLEKVNGHR